MRPSLRARLLRSAALQVLAMPLVALALLLGTASSAQAVQDTTMVLATEGHGGPPPGLDPREANDPENEFRPVDYEQNFLWGAAVGLGVMVIGGFAGVGALYWLLVVRPSQQSTAGQH